MPGWARLECAEFGEVCDITSVVYWQLLGFVVVAARTPFNAVI
jgi:hypothetical protein